MEIITNRMYTVHWNESDLWNICRICLKTMPLERVSIFNNIKFVCASSSLNKYDIEKPHELRILELILFCCNNISVIKINKLFLQFELILNKNIAI